MSEIQTHCEQHWLRPLRISDLSVIAGWLEDVEDLALFHARMPVPLSGESLEAAWRESLLSAEPRGSYWYLIVDHEKRALGFGGIESINYVHGGAVTPLFITRPSRGKGLGLRARALLLDLAFDQLRLKRITSYHRVDNTASTRLNLACGFKPEGRIRSGWFADGRFIDLNVYGILAEEWRECRVPLSRSLSPAIQVSLGEYSGAGWTWPKPVG